MFADAMNPAAPLDRLTVARAWAWGWAISRGTAAPVDHAGVLRIAVGRPDQTVRHVMPSLDAPALRRLIEGAEAGTWLKICADRAQVAPLLPVHWRLHEPEFLMGAPLSSGGLPALAGYRHELDREGALWRVQVLSETGEVAASGQAAVDGAFATFDQIVTAEAHRRRGLGSRVMAALTRAALMGGATHGVLVATQAGAALYQALGWTMVSPVTAAQCLPR